MPLLRLLHNATTHWGGCPAASALFAFSADNCSVKSWLARVSLSAQQSSWPNAPAGMWVAPPDQASSQNPLWARQARANHAGSALPRISASGLAPSKKRTLWRA